jgi:(p)ppGpp synthase/HD superfamily hydrolase
MIFLQHFEVIMENLQQAIEFAASAHRDQQRKSTDIPYITHPFAVAMLLQQDQAPENLVIAGLLHDVIEDTLYTLDDIGQQFGSKVMDIVRECSERDKSRPWEERKREFIDQLRTASFEAQWVTCADKYHNLFTINRELSKKGPSVWKRFKRGYHDQKWYYQAIDDILTSQTRLQNSFLLINFHHLVQSVFNWP